MKRDRYNAALSGLKSYNGDNPYLQMLRDISYSKGGSFKLSDFQVSYVESNLKYKMRRIGKMASMVNWYAEKKKSDWDCEFIPSKIMIYDLVGETEDYYHCFVQYRRSVPPKLEFILKKGLLDDVTYEDYNLMDVDFDRYDNLSTSINTERRLREHQKDAVRFLLTRKKCILADSMGLGKTTSMAVAAIEGNFDSIVIICPASIKTTWRDELKWYVNERDITIIDSCLNKNKSELESYLGYAPGKSNKKRDELLEEAKSKSKWNDNRFVIINYDILDEVYKVPSTRSKANIDKAFEKSPMLNYISNRKSLVIIDEAHRLSNKKSGRYKIISDLIKRGNPDSIYLSTGTPITNNPENLYCVLKLINHPVVGDWNYYMERYCNLQRIPAKGERKRLTDLFISKSGKSSWGELSYDERKKLDEYIDKYSKKINKTNGSSNLGELESVISKIYLRRVKEELDESLKKVIHEIRYDLTPTEHSEYMRLWDEYEKQKLEEDPDKVLNKTLMEGAIYRQYLSNIMVPKTISITDELVGKGKKVVIACCFDNELYTLKEHYGDKCVIYNGKMNAKQKDLSVDRFMNDDSCMIFIGNIMAAGVGITLISSHHLVFNDIDYVPGNNFQMQDRICRIGQRETCHIYYQMFNDTQYEKIWDIAMKKSFTIDQIIKTEREKNG